MKKLIRIIDVLFNKLIFFYYKVKCLGKVVINGRIFIKGNKNSIVIGRDCTINSNKVNVPLGYQDQCYLWCFNSGKISIGNCCGISNATICSAIGVTIEDNVLIGGGVKIFDTDFHSLRYEKRIDIENDDDRKALPVLIKEGAFIGGGSTILKGVTIGEKSIVGAGSVVTKDIPAGEIWGGNPAKFIKVIEV